MMTWLPGGRLEENALRYQYLVKNTLFVHFASSRDSTDNLKYDPNNEITFPIVKNWSELHS